MLMWLIIILMPKAVFKQHNPCSNHEIHVLFEHGFWLKSIEVVGQCDVTSLFCRNKMADTECAPQFSVSF